MIQLSATIITYNEERNIERCLLSLQGVVDEIVVVDSFSTDRTKEICLRYHVSFWENPFHTFMQQKNKALDLASYPYVLSLDADEELSPELRNSILEVKRNWTADGYYFNRLTNFCGKWIHHSGWYPDRKLRLWNKEKGIWGGNPHEKVLMDAACKIQFLKGDLNHYSYYSKKDFVARTIKYSSISANSLYLQGKNPLVLKLVFAPFWRFIKHYCIGLGFLDGRDGLFISWISSKGVYYKYKELRQLNQKKRE